MTNRRMTWLIWGIAALFFLLTMTSSLVNLVVDYWWFRSVDQLFVYQRRLAVQLSLFLLFFLATLFFLGLNIFVASRILPDRPQKIRENLFEIRANLKLQRIMWLRILWVGAVFIALMTGLDAAQRWEALLLYGFAQPFGRTDPIFGEDIGFYLFRLPLLNYLYTTGFYLALTAGVGLGTFYVAEREVRVVRRMPMIFTPARAHLGALAILIFLWRAWGYHLERFQLLMKQGDVLHGAGYADVHATLPVLNVLMVVCLLCAAAALAVVIFKLYLLLLAAVGALGLALLANWIFPLAVHRLVVLPNEAERERPYLEHHIAYTRAAYGLDRFRQQVVNVRGEVSGQALESYRPTVENIRLWDYRPLRQVYQQLQGIRPYYTFLNVHVDRYPVDGVKKQVAIAVRELDPARVPSRTWINVHFVYTHGIGVVMSPVSETTEEGLPKFWIKDIPPQSTFFELKRPQIYFGEQELPFSIVKTGVKEFDYPAGEESIYTSYDGRGGVPVGGWIPRLVFSLFFSDPKILLSREIHDESLLLLYRSIFQRVQKAAPFLAYDRNPYPVVYRGRIYWVLDAYTVSQHFPYAWMTENLGAKLNYARNTVKAVIDAYDGALDFYIVDDQDPLIRAYREMFPTLFKPFSDMPAGLREHLRYPVGFFSLQADVYARFHMQDPFVFYNQEDVWDVPKERFEEDTIEMEPYYAMLQLRKEEEPHYVLMLPYTPQRRENMSAWIAAHSDPGRYGDVVVYLFPRDRLVYGPMQVENRIDQDAEISQRFTLWGQRGSRILRGNLLVIPVEEGMLFVEPVYLQAEHGKIPELRRVIASMGDRIVMGSTLMGALEELLGASAAPPRPSLRRDAAAGLDSGAVSPLELLNQADQALRAGDFARFGEKWAQLRQALEAQQKP